MTIATIEPAQAVIDTGEVFVGATSAAELVITINVLIAKGDKAAGKAQQYYISAGQHLKVLKSNYTASWAEWEKLLKEECQISTGRASELMQIADGRKTVAEIRDNAAERNRQLRSRKSSSSRDEETGVSSLDEAMQPKPGQKVITAEQRMAEFAADDEGEVTDKDRRKQFLLMAAGAIECAQTLDKHFNAKPNADVLDAARCAADEWTKLAEKLEPPDSDDGIADMEQNLIKEITSAVSRGDASQRIETIGFIRNAIIDLALRVDEIDTTKDWSGSDRRCAKKVLAAFQD